MVDVGVVVVLAVSTEKLVSDGAEPMLAAPKVKADLDAACLPHRMSRGPGQARADTGREYRRAHLCLLFQQRHCADELNLCPRKLPFKTHSVCI